MTTISSQILKDTRIGNRHADSLQFILELEDTQGQKFNALVIKTERIRKPQVHTLCEEYCIIYSFILELKGKLDLYVPVGARDSDISPVDKDSGILKLYGSVGEGEYLYKVLTTINSDSNSDL